MAYLGATLHPGIDFVLDALDFSRHISTADLVITGEGRSDGQTLMGKAPYGILRRARQSPRFIPVHILSGEVTETEALLAAGFTSATSINAVNTYPLNTLLRPEVATANLATAAARLLATR